MPLKDKFGKKSQGCIVLSLLIYLKILKKDNSGNLVASPTQQVGESIFDYKYPRDFDAEIGTARKLV
jgi:hypothetical protein